GGTWLRVRIELKILGIRERLDEARRGGDHRGVVGAERKRREGGSGKRRAELRVGGDAADDGDLFRPDRLRRRERPLHERAHDRALVARRQVGAASLELGRGEVSYGV